MTNVIHTAEMYWEEWVSDIKHIYICTYEKSSFIVFSSAVKPGTHFLENNKVTGVFAILKLCVSKEPLAQ